MATTINGRAFWDGAITLSGREQAPGGPTGPIDLPPDATGDGRTLFLDVQTLTGHARGGDDIAQLPDFVTVVGDAESILGHARGGDDHLSGTRFGGDVIGDALRIACHGRGGDDVIETVIRGGHALGDAEAMTDHARGGDDAIAIGGRFVFGYGDALTLDGHARGGDDVLRLTGQDLGTLLGDGSLSGHARGGDDVLYAAPGQVGPSVLYGDGETLRDHAVAGNDVLVASAKADILWGDGLVIGDKVRTGHDRFVFDAHGGADTIMDFEHRKDVIDLRAMADDGIHRLSDLVLTSTQTADGYDVLVQTGHGTEILVHADAMLTARDFLFG